MSDFSFENVSSDRQNPNDQKYRMMIERQISREITEITQIIIGHFSWPKSNHR